MWSNTGPNKLSGQGSHILKADAMPARMSEGGSILEIGKPLCICLLEAQVLSPLLLSLTQSQLSLQSSTIGEGMQTKDTLCFMVPSQDHQEAQSREG